MEKEKVKKVHQYVLLLSSGRLGGQIGNKNEGARSEVFIGFKIDNPRKLYAIKMINLDELTSKDRDEYFLTKDLKNNNLLTVYSSLQTKNHYYYVTEFCPQGSLETYLQNERTELSESVAISLISSVLNGYHAMNDQNLIHRDIKPANILLKNCIVKICDYGFARFVNNPNKYDSMTLKGTPMFMAPELFDEKGQYNHKCDIWSLGVLFYKILVGKYPFSGVTFEELKYNIRKFPLEFPNYIELSEEIKNVIEKMLDKNKDTRISLSDLIKLKIFKNNSLEESISKEKNPAFLDYLCFNEEDSENNSSTLEDQVFEAKDCYLRVKSCFKSLTYLSHLRNRLELLDNIIKTIKKKNKSKKEKLDNQIIYLLNMSLDNEVQRINSIIDTLKEKKENEFFSKAFYKMKNVEVIKEKLLFLYFSYTKKIETTQNEFSGFFNSKEDEINQFQEKIEKYMKQLNTSEKSDLILKKKLRLCYKYDQLESLFSFDENLNFAKRFAVLKNYTYRNEVKYETFCQEFY